MFPPNELEQMALQSQKMETVGIEPTEDTSRSVSPTFAAALEQERNRCEPILTSAEEDDRLREFQESVEFLGDQSSVPGGVYFIQHGPGGPIKIGWTASAPRVRMATLQVGTPAPLRLIAWWDGASRADEKDLHQHFDEHRITGEWFESAWALWDYMALFPVRVSSVSSQTGEGQP